DFIGCLRRRCTERQRRALREDGAKEAAAMFHARFAFAASDDPLSLLRSAGNVKLAKLFEFNLGRRVRHQIETAVVLRKGNHLANAFRADREHDQPVEPKRDAAMW